MGTHSGDRPRPSLSRRARRRVRRLVRRRERRRIGTLLRAETVGGALLVAAALAALIVANSPAGHWYATVREWQVGPAALGLHLSIGEWTADGLLAVFFFLAGLELKREFVAGELRDPRRAVVPVMAAVGGMIVPALIYTVVNLGHEGAGVGWAIPTATDIAFALAVLAVVGHHPPTASRTFLLTLAVVDDLLAIVVIALFYTRELRLGSLLLAMVTIAVFTALIQRARHVGPVRWVALPALAIVGWALMHSSGVHATVAGVLMGFAVPVLGRRRGDRRLPAPEIADRLDHALRPVSAGLAVPMFAFFAAGVAVGGLSGLGTALSSRITLGIVAGLVAGKTIGIFVATLVTARLARSTFIRGLALTDLVGLAVLGGIGFTVSLLIGRLAFGAETTADADVQIGVVVGSVVAAILAAAILVTRDRHYRAMSARR